VSVLRGEARGVVWRGGEALASHDEAAGREGAEMRFASFFSGIGGFDLGLSRAGHERVYSCEIEPFPRAVFQHHFGHEPEGKDIRDVDPREIHRADLWCGGFPCQDLSTAGLRAGIDGERSGLVWKFLELAEHVRPRWMLLENVPGLLSVDGGHAFGRVLARLGELGFRWAYRVLDARHFGVPQRRRRVFILAGRAGDGLDPGAVLLEPEGRGGDPAARVSSWADPSVSPPLGAHHSRLSGDAEPLAYSVTAREAKGPDSSSSSSGNIVAFDLAQVTHPENRSRCEPGEPSPTLHATPPPPHIAYPIQDVSVGAIKS